MSVTTFASDDDAWSNDPLWSPENVRALGDKGGPNGKDWNSENGWYVDDKGGVHAIRNRFIDARDSDGHKVDISWRLLGDETLASIDKESKVAEIFEKNGYVVPKNTDFIPLLSGDIIFDNGVPEGGGVVTFQLGDLGVDPQGLKPGDTVYVMQETSPGSGVWEVYAAQVGSNYDIAVTLPRNGALVLVKTLANGVVVALDKTTGEVISTTPSATVTPSGATSTSTNASGATSPKTGEF